MKKILLILLMLILCVLITPVFFVVNADEESKFNTIYPENIIDYKDLTNISKISISNNYIAFVCETGTSTLTIINKSTRKTYTYNTITDIQEIEHLNDILLVTTKTNVYAIKDNEIITLSDLSFSNVTAIDIYSNSEYAYLGFVENNSFKIYSINANLDVNTNAILNLSNDNYLNTYMLTLNNNHAYLVNDNHKIFTIDIKNKTLINENNFIVEALHIDTIEFINTEYIVSYYPNLSLFSTDSFNDEIATVKRGEVALEDPSIKFPLTNVTDLEVFNNTIYICDDTYKTIQSYEIKLNTNGDKKFVSKDILVSSQHSYLGRFNNVNDITIYNNSIYIADTNNKRIQIINEYNNVLPIPTSNSKSPIALAINNKGSLYSATTDSINKYNLKITYDNDGNQIKTYHEDNTFAIINCNIADMAINNNNTIFILNPVSNKIEYIQNNSVITLKEYSSIEIQDNDEIEYLKSLDCFVVLSNNKVYLISSTGEILDSLLIENSSNITTDLSCIYVKANNNITLLKVVDNKLVTTEQSVIDNCLTNTSVMSYDINNEKLYTFDNKTQKIIYLNNNLNSNQLQFENFNTSNPLNSTSTLLPIKLKNTLIYENPYYTGKVYNESHTIDKCLGIEKHGEFYRVLFNYNDTLNCGFIHQNDILQISQLPNKSNIKVLTTNDIVPVYKYPTILKYDNKTIITGTLPINTKITLDYAYPISIDNKTMYFYNDGTNIGFIYNADVVLDESKNIENLHSDNASIKLIGKDETYIYAEDKTTILYTLKNDDRIHVTNYDKNSDYTLVYYTTSSLETIEGYVPTKDINVDNLDITKIILICLICVSIVILIIIAISYINIKRNQKFNKKEEI